MVVSVCLFAASPQGAQSLTSTATTIAALQLYYSQLISLYQQLRQQDVANQETVLDNLINQSVTVVSNLKTTIDTMMQTGDAYFVLYGYQVMVANGLTNLLNAQSDE
jgi:hypothetical protein